jgi:4-diphosphocytidyl-2-C-methyl-D-erythritol kinase
MVVFPPCKINLGLAVLSKRPDGYHNLETCFYTVPWLDVLEVISSDEFSFTSTGTLIPGAPENNLCVKAYRLLEKDFDMGPVKIHLHKIIPSGAGLGGGSSDAAYMLRLLNDKFSLNLSPETLMGYAAQLGSDCAYFIQDNPMIGTGRGEILKEISLSLQNRFLAIVKPHIHVSTADAFGGITPKESSHAIETIVRKYPVEEWKSILKNDFEETVFKKYPLIKSVKDKLYGLGAMYASMSGSGSAVYGIFNSDENIARHFSDATVWAGKVY